MYTSCLIFSLKLTCIHCYINISKEKYSALSQQTQSTTPTHLHPHIEFKKELVKGLKVFLNMQSVYI